MPKTKAAKATAKIKKDKHGRLYLRYGKKRIYADPEADIPERKFLKWMIKYLKPKRRKVREKKSGVKGETPSAIQAGPSRAPAASQGPINVSVSQPSSSLQDLERSKQQFLEAAESQTNKKLDGVQRNMIEGLSHYASLLPSAPSTHTEHKESKRGWPQIYELMTDEEKADLEARAAKAEAKAAEEAEGKKEAEARAAASSRAKLESDAKAEEDARKASEHKNQADTATQQLREQAIAQHKKAVEETWLAKSRDALYVELKTLTGEEKPMVSGTTNKQWMNKDDLFIALTAIPGSGPNKRLQVLIDSDSRLKAHPPLTPPPVPARPRRKSLSDVTGSGKVLRQAPLRGDEVQRIMSVWRDYAGTIARNNLKALGKIKPVGGCVMNTDPPGAPGQHWVAIYWDAKQDKSIEYYDPFGDPCPADVLEHMIKPIVAALNTKEYLKFKENRIKNQSVTTQNCGWHCTDFLINRARGITFAKTTGFEPKRISNVEEHEARIAKLKTQFPEFGVL